MTTTRLPAKRQRVSAKQRRTAAAADLAVAVLRVSTQGQADSGLATEAQRDAVEAFASRQGLRLVVVVEDTISGTVSLEQRPGMARALALLASGEAGVLVAARADRLTRKTSDLYALMDRSHRESWCIRAADAVVDTCSDSGRLMAQVAGLFAEQERRLISARTFGALQAKRLWSDGDAACARFSARPLDGWCFRNSGSPSLTISCSRAAMRASCSSSAAWRCASAGRWRSSTVHPVRRCDAA